MKGRGGENSPTRIVLNTEDDRGPVRMIRNVTDRDMADRSFILKFTHQTFPVRYWPHLSTLLCEYINGSKNYTITKNKLCGP
jgi:hypothetical protein